MAPAGPDPASVGGSIVNLDFLGTGVFAAISIAGAVAGGTVATVAAGVSLAMFAVGCACFLWAYAVGVSRSRDETVTLAALFFLAGSAPPAVAFRLRLALALQIVIAVGTAAARLYSELAFGVLAPMFGLGLMALWGSRHGDFPPREQPSRERSA